MYKGTLPFHEDMIRITDRLPSKDEYRRVRHLVLQRKIGLDITDDELAQVVGACPHLETAVLSGVRDTSDRTIITLSKTAINLMGIDVSGCQEVTDLGILDILSQSLPLQWVMLNGVKALTDPSISAISKSCSRLIELELCDLPLLSPLSVRDVWTYSRKLRTLRLARCPLLSDKAFPSPISFSESDYDKDGEKPLPHRPITWLEVLPPLVLSHTAENLRILDLASCKITDDAIAGIVRHAPKIQTLNLSGCVSLTDRALECICSLGEHLDVLILAHVSNITDSGVVKLARSCFNLRCVDVAFCRNLTDMAVFELASINSLRRLSLIRVHKLTDIAIFALAEHAIALERLHLCYCDRLSLDAIHLLLKKLDHLQHLTVTGIPSFQRRGVHRFSDPPPVSYNVDQQAAFLVFDGISVGNLRRFLNKEEIRRREAEARNIPFTPRSDDKIDLY
ncbi:hypothetical protein DFS33DRAFT_1314407 [Desarmillaria ectypa]|nr:hypothetical protein DFS33DRAFT_1314407 [Desarmillaria ectypa]